MSARAEQFDQVDESPALLDAARVLRERWWLVLGAVVACLGVTLVLSLSSTTEYQATATVLVRSNNLATLIEPSLAQSQDQARTQGDNLNLVRSLAVAQRVKAALGLHESVDNIRSNLSAVEVPNTDLIDVTYTDPSASRAAMIANEFGSQLVSFLNDADQTQVAQGKAAITSQLAQLSPTDPSRSVLLQALSRVTALRAVSSGNVVVIDSAQVPRHPSSPKVKRDVIVGGLVGVVLGLSLAFLINLFDRRIKDVEDFERLYGRAPLASVQLQRARPETERERQFELEPFRILRDGLDFLSLGERVQVVMVTSAAPSEGKTKVATGLARAAALGGRTVALVEADLHRPTITQVLGLEPQRRGLTNVLSESSSPSSAMREMPGFPTLSVLTSGPLTPNAAELLRSPAMESLLRELRRDHDFVVIDVPPLLHVSDAQVLMDNPLVDVALVVARPYVTTREQARGARAVLARHPDPAVGLVINGIRDTAGAYYYGGGDNGAGAPPTGTRARRIGARRGADVRS
jgi:receptor protein-tyrosine kinase